LNSPIDHCRDIAPPDMRFDELTFSRSPSANVTF
jgi:hypothetical protein